MILLLDCDEVLCDFSGEVLRLAQKLNLTMPPENAVEWDLFNAFPPEEALCLRQEVSKRGFCLNLPPFPAAQEAVKHLHYIGATIVCVTSPWNGPYWVYERQLWLQEHFQIGKQHTINTKAKHLVRGDVFVDDKPSMVLRWSQMNPGRPAWLWHTKYCHERACEWSLETPTPSVDVTNNWLNIVACVEGLVWAGIVEPPLCEELDKTP